MAAGIADSVELAIQAVFLSALPIMIVGFVLALFLKEIPLRETIGPTTPVEGAGETATDPI